MRAAMERKKSRGKARGKARGKPRERSRDAAPGRAKGEGRGEDRRPAGPRERPDRGPSRGAKRGEGSDRRGDGSKREAPWHRRSLSNVGGEVETRGDPALAQVLERALKATTRDHDHLTQGFHAYPARIHPAVPAIVLDALADRRTRVLDPFCGGGTVLIEARVRGMRAAGVDLNPLALRVAEVRLDRRNRAARDRFRGLLMAIGERSEERVRARVPSRAPLSKEERDYYDPHVLLELAGLREEILQVGHVGDRRALEVLLSSIVVKVSRQRADTSGRRADQKRIRKGLSTEFFVRKGKELLERWQALDEACPPRAPRPLLIEGDATELSRLLGDRSRPDMIVSSPPYGGTYDYLEHHRRRYSWLGLDPSRLARGEIGARRNLRGADAAERWEHEVMAALRAMSLVLERGALVVLLVGDAQVGGRRVSAGAQLARLGRRARLEIRASASQPREDPMGGRPRREHLVVLERV